MTFVIKEHRPGRWRLLTAVVTVLWLGSAWLAYEAGRYYSSHDREAALARHLIMQEQLAELQLVKGQLESQVSILQRSAQVDREAKVQLAKEMKDLQDLQADLREEISFYKSIISPPKDEVGVGIYSLSLYPGDNRIYHYKIVLTQSGKSDTLVKGKLSVRLEGVLNESEKELNLRDISVADKPQLSYKFKYFEEISGSFRLPENYMPRAVVIGLRPTSGKTRDKPVKTFDWQKLRLNRDDFDG